MASRFSTLASLSRKTAELPCVVEFHQNLIFLDHIAFFNHDFGYDAGVEALDDLLTAAGNDIAVAAGHFFDRAVVCPDDEDNQEKEE